MFNEEIESVIEEQLEILSKKFEKSDCDEDLTEELVHYFIEDVVLTFYGDYDFKHKQIIKLDKMARMCLKTTKRKG